MLFFSHKLSVAAAAIVSLASVTSADYYIDPKSVSSQDRVSWCQNELSTCPLICQAIDGMVTQVNECDSETLTYGCICGSGQAPNVSQYTLTLPYFTCVEYGNQCVARCGSDNMCAGRCRTDHPCGAQNPRKPNTTSTASDHASSASATATSSPVHTNVVGGGSRPGSGAPASLPAPASVLASAGFASVMLALALAVL